MHLHIVVPDLFWPSTEEQDVYQGLRLPALEVLLARGRRGVGEIGGYGRWVAAHFGLHGEDPPIAPYRLFGEGIDPGSSHWLCADPVHLQAGRDRVLMTESEPLDAGEASALAESLDRHFRADAIELLAPETNRWYLRATDAQAFDQDLQTTPLEFACGQVTEQTLPRGAAGARWRTRLTEAQMIMHDHPVNQAREARGAAPVNGIWVWGGGQRTPLPSRRSERWYADDALTRGLARAAEAATGGAPASLRREELASEGVRWIVLAGATQRVRRGDAPGWRESLAKLEADWFAPLVELLKRGAIGMASVHAVSPLATLSVEATRSDLRHLWHRPRGLVTYLAGAGAA
jgi:hypothetical protein